MSQHFLRPSLLAASLALACAAPAAWSQAGAAAQFYDLPAQPLNATVARIASESGVNVSVDAALVRGRMAPPVRGTYTAEDALRQALAGSGLELARTPSGALTLRAAPAQATPAEASNPGATTLQQIDVQAAPERSPVSEGSGSYAAAAVTIGKGEQSLKEIPQSVSVVTRQQIDDQKLRTLDEVLLATPGVVVEMDSSHERIFYSRGFEVDTVQYDGVPTLRRNGFNTSHDMIAYDRVEVLRGPAGLFNGAGQAGGTVNLVRKRPLATQRLNAQATLGRWDYRRGEFDFSLPVNEAGSIRARFTGAHQQQKYFYDVAESKRTVLYGIIETDLAPRTQVGVGFHYEKNDMTPFYGGLPRFSDGRDLGLPRSTYLNAAWSETHIRATTLFADFNHSFNENWKFKVGVTRMKEDNSDLSGSNYGAVSPTPPHTGPTISSFRARLLGEQTGVDSTLTGRFQAFGRDHELRIGANYQKRDYDYASQLYTVTNPSIDPFDFDPYDYATAPTVPARAASNTLAQVIQSGLYGSLKWSLTDPLDLIVGARYSRWKTSTRNLVTGAYNTQPYSERGEITPYAALTYDIAPAWTVYASYAEIFKSQANQFTAEGERLKPATGSNVELGIKGNLLDGSVNTSLALFRIIESNRSQTDPAHPRPCAGSPTGGACYIAEGKVRSQGLDAEISGRVLPGLMVVGGYTYNQTKYLHDASSQGMPLSSFTPRHLLRLWATYQLPGELSAWTVSGGVNMQSSAYKIDSNTRIAQGGYSVWSARLGYRINRHLSAGINVNNIFDKTYYRTLGRLGGGNWYGEPLNVMATLQATF